MRADTSRIRTQLNAISRLPWARRGAYVIGPPSSFIRFGGGHDASLVRAPESTRCALYDGEWRSTRHGGHRRRRGGRGKLFGVLGAGEGGSGGTNRCSVACRATASRCPWLVMKFSTSRRALGFSIALHFLRTCCSSTVSASFRNNCSIFRSKTPAIFCNVLKRGSTFRLSSLERVITLIPALVDTSSSPHPLSCRSWRITCPM